MLLGRQGMLFVYTPDERFKKGLCPFRGCNSAAGGGWRYGAEDQCCCEICWSRADTVTSLDEDDKSYCIGCPYRKAKNAD